MSKFIGIFIMMIFTGTIFTSLGTNNVVNAENIFFEGFEEGIMPPSGWYLEESNPDLGWFIGDQGVLNGSFCAWMNFDNSNEKDNWLISPNFDISVYGEVYLEFWGKSDTNYPSATVEVHIRGDGFDDVVWDLISDEYWDFFDWYEVQIDLSSYAGEIINLSWRYIGQGGESFGLDDIRLFGFVNTPPSIPTIKGDKVGKPGESYDYNVMSIDSEGNDVTYCIDWGDGTPEVCNGPYDSGTEQSFSHVWEVKGDFIIRVKARDSNGAESEWGTFVVSMPIFKQQSITNRGDFYAEIGLNGDQKSFANLEGTIKNRGRIIIVNGIVEKDNRESRFQGLFRGSFFILQFPINNRIGNIFGQVRINSDTKEFTGLWKTRGSRLNGWIEGSFN